MSGRPEKYPVKRLAVGQCIYVENGDVTRVGNAVRHRKPMRFLCKTVVKHGTKLVKVVRIG